MKINKNRYIIFVLHKRRKDNFSYALVDAKGYDDESVKGFQSKLLKVMMLFEKSTEFAQILKTIEKYKSELIGLNDEEKRILSVAFDILSKVHKSSQEYDLNKILYAKNEEGVSTMMPSLLDNVENYEKNLIKRATRKVKKEHEIEIRTKNDEIRIKDNEIQNKDNEIQKLKEELNKYINGNKKTPKSCKTEDKP